MRGRGPQVSTRSRTCQEQTLALDKMVDEEVMVGKEKRQKDGRPFAFSQRQEAAYLDCHRLRGAFRNNPIDVRRIQHFLFQEGFGQRLERAHAIGQHPLGPLVVFDH